MAAVEIEIREDPGRQMALRLKERERRLKREILLLPLIKKDKC